MSAKIALSSGLAIGAEEQAERKWRTQLAEPIYRCGELPAVKRLDGNG